jgi:diguanylate cyclase (GGDEF)-like protein
LTEQVPEYLEAIVDASIVLNVPIEDLTQDQFMSYFDRNSNERRKALKAIRPEIIQGSDWEKAKELASVIDSASKQIAEKYRFKIVTPQEETFEIRQKFGRFITVNSRRRVFELSMITTLLCVILSIGVLFLITLLDPSVTFKREFLPTIAIPLIFGPIVSYIIFSQSYQLTQAVAKLDELSRTDPLTGLYNRRFFTELVDMELAVASRYEFSSSLLLIDLDHFKRINEDYGHVAGDEVLRIISKVIRRNVRRTDVVGRLGGEEFLVFLPHTNLYGALIAADRVRRIISESEITFKNEKLSITASIGTAATSHEIIDIEGLLQAADSALTVAKNNGHDLVEGISQTPTESEIDPEVIEVQSK